MCRNPGITKNSDDKSSKMEIKSISGEYSKSCKESYEGYFKVFKDEKAIKKSDIHILIPLFLWEERVEKKRRKAWSYSVIPLPKESGNNFTFTAHLFPKQTREGLEIHQENVKKEWMEKVLRSGARLFIKTYDLYIKKMQGMDGYGEEIKQKIILDYLPAPRLSDWVNVALNDKQEKTDILFSWNEIPGKENNHLKDILFHNYSIDWVKNENVKITKIDNGKIIKIFNNRTHISLELNDKNELILIDGRRKIKFNVRMENNGLNIYEPVINEYIFNDIFNKKLLFFEGRWYAPLDSTGSVSYPRNDKERWLLEKMDLVTFSESFLNHHRFKELTEFKDKLIEQIQITDKEFISNYEEFFSEMKKKKGKVMYGESPLNKEFIEKLIENCLITPPKEKMSKIMIIPNALGELCSPEELKKEPKGKYSELKSIIPSYLSPHEDFISFVANDIKEIDDLEELLEGVKEHTAILEKNFGLINILYEWIYDSKVRLPKNIREYPLVLSDNGNLVSINDVFWVPTHHHDIIKQFLLSNKDSTLLVSKSIFEEFSSFICSEPLHNRLEGDSEKNNLKVKMFDYPGLVKKYFEDFDNNDDTKKELKKTIIEGILIGLSNNSWHYEDLKDLPFLPVQGKLRIPETTCIGTTNDEEINQFLGVIDMYIQEMINANDYKGILTELKCGDVIGDEIGCIIRRIDRFAEKNNDEEGICRLDERHHRLISNCLNRLTQIPNFGGDPRIYEIRILPVDYRGYVILYTPPRWDMKTGKRRREKYERDWPWVRPDRRLRMEADPVWKSIKFLSLHKDYRTAEKQIISEFGIEHLIAKDGNPIGLMMYYLVPSEIQDTTSLFCDQDIREFVDYDLTDSDIKNIKMVFIEYFKIYYNKTDHKTETRVTTKDKRCLYDINGTWRIPGEFSLRVDEDLEILGFYKLHDDFSEEKGWDKQTLKNIGVVDDLEFCNVENAIKKISSETRDTNSDRKILKILILTLRDGIGTKEEWEQLSEVRWVPVRSNERKKPNDTLLLTEKARQIIGDHDLRSLVDITSLNEENKNVILNLKEEDIQKIGIRTDPTKIELINLWVHFQKENKVPPSELFNAIEKKFDNWEKEVIKFDTTKVKYYCENEWRDPMSVVMDNPDKVPKSLRERFSLTSKHEKLLKMLRGELKEEGRPKIKARDALAILQDIPDGEVEPVWKFIIERQNEIDKKLKDEFGSKNIFLYEGQWYQPLRVLIAPRGSTGLKYKGNLGDWLSISPETDTDEIDTLVKLGALEFNAIIKDQNLLNDLLTFILDKDPQPGNDLWSDYVKILSIMIDTKMMIPLDFPVIPIISDHNIVFKEPKKILLKDESGIWEMFKDEKRLNIFDPVVINKEGFADKLHGWLKSNGVKSVRDVLRTIEEPDISNAEEEVDLTNNLSNILNVLDGFVRKTFSEADMSLIDQKIGRLRNVTIYSCKDIMRQYDIDMSLIDGGAPISKKVNRDYYFDSEHNVVFVRKDIEYPIAAIKEMVIQNFNPDFEDISKGKFWDLSLDIAFSNRIVTPTTPEEISFPIEPQNRPEIRNNLNKIDQWWATYISDDIQYSFPTLDGDFWWHVLGLDDNENKEKRVDILTEELPKNRKLMFNLLSMATLLSTNVTREAIKNFIDILNDKKLSFSEIYEMEEEDVIKKMIDDMFVEIDSKGLSEAVYPDLRRRIFDILTLRRAMKDKIMGSTILQMMKVHQEDGLSPELFLTRGIGYGARPFMKGFRGMFTGQIYFIVREMVRLGLADKWRSFAFHAPSQVRELIDNIGGNIPSQSEDGWRAVLAKDMMKNIEYYPNLKGWFDIPFFIYCDEFCRKCNRGHPPKECEMDCYRGG